MADRLDQPYGSIDQDAVNIEKWNRLNPGGMFRQNIPESSNIIIVGIKASVLPNESQRRGLETAINAINGVQASKVLIYGTGPSAAEIPSGCYVDVVGEARFRIERS